MSPNPEAARLLVDAFLSGRKATTLAAYRQDLEHFVAFASAADSAAAASRLLTGGHGQANAMALAYKAAMIEGKLAPATVNRRLSALRSLVHVARILGMVQWQLEVENVTSQAYRDTKGPGREGVQALLTQLAKRSDPKGARDRAIVRLAYDLGLRRAEITTLDVADVDLKGGTVEILGKGKREKIKVTLPKETKDVLEAWLASRGNEPGALFLNLDHRPAHRGKRIAGNSVRRIIARLGDAVGVRARPHGIRHAAITEGLDVTRDPRAVRRFSRHAKLETLMVYDDNRRDLAGEVARKVAAGVHHHSPVAAVGSSSTAGDLSAESPAVQSSMSSSTAASTRSRSSE